MSLEDPSRDNDSSGKGDNNSSDKETIIYNFFRNKKKLNSETITKFRVTDYYLNKHNQKANMCSVMRASKSDDDNLLDNAVVSKDVDYQQNLLTSQTFERFKHYIVTISGIDSSEWKMPLTSFLFSELNHDIKLNEASNEVLVNNNIPHGRVEFYNYFDDMEALSIHERVWTLKNNGSRNYEYEKL